MLRHTPSSDRRCSSCDQLAASVADEFFLKHRGLCSDDYHAGVAVREAELAASRPQVMEEEVVMLGMRPKLLDVPAHSFVQRSNRLPRPPKVYAAPKPKVDVSGPLPLCTRGCGNEVARHTHRICRACISKEAQARWTEGAREWARRQAELRRKPAG